MRYWAAGLLLTVLLFGGGLLGTAKSPSAARPVPDNDPGQAGENAGQTAADANTLLQVWDGEQVVEMTMAEYLPGVVRGEMPAAFHQQALDAQAVAERTFIYYHMASGRKAAHPDADACMDYAAAMPTPPPRRRRKSGATTPPNTRPRSSRPYGTPTAR